MNRNANLNVSIGFTPDTTSLLGQFLTFLQQGSTKMSELDDRITALEQDADELASVVAANKKQFADINTELTGAKSELSDIKSQLEQAGDIPAAIARLGQVDGRFDAILDDLKASSANPATLPGDGTTPNPEPTPNEPPATNPDGSPVTT